ncbi:MAG TPA: chorismate mutase [Thermoanaerobaculia bacterium]|nr:chorismate mutase [Thermoanaerobaculia bacterium]
MSSNDPLSDLRDAISDVDRAMLELLRRRMDLAAEVGRLKASTASPIVVRDVEDRVLTRARHYAEACGVSEKVMEQVFAAIIQGSIERQHRVGISLREQRGERMLLLGGSGGLGTWLRGFFELAGHVVDLVDPALGSLPRSPGRFARLEDVPDLDAYAALWVSVPLARTPQVVDQLVARSPKGVIVEVASIKDPLASVLARARERGVRVIALHPMFGPSKSFYEELTFVLASHDDPGEERRLLDRLLLHPYTRLVTVPFPRHDELMGWLLGLAHLTNIVFGAAVTRSGVSPDELRACASTTFTRQVNAARPVLNEDPDLYLDIQHLNPHRHEVYAATREALEQIEALVERRDREGFRELLTAARRALGEGG